MADSWMKVSTAYIAGPMTGIPFYNAPAFRSAAKDWCASGWMVTTPLDAASIVWQRHYDRDFDPERDTCGYGDPLMGEVWVENMKALTEADAVAFLPGWERSNGATAEYMAASALGKDLRDTRTFGKLAAPPLSICQEADRIVTEDRQNVYGHPFDDFSKTGRLWAVILGLPVVTPEQVALCLLQVKVSRLMNSPSHRDSMVDVCGYMKTYFLVRERRTDHVRLSPG